MSPTLGSLMGWGGGDRHGSSSINEEEMVEYTNSSTMDDGVELSTVETSAVLEGNQQQQQQVPPWRQQLTLRALVVSFFLGIMFTIIVAMLVLSTKFMGTLNLSAGLLGFFFLKVWVVALQKSGLLRQPFTPQENTVIQTCVVATYTVAVSGGFGSYLLGMSEKIAKQTAEANAAQNIKNPRLGWMMGFLFLVSFLGLLSALLLSKIMIIDYKLIYPSGTAAAHLINSVHTPQGTKLEKKRVRLFGKFFSLSFLWGLFQWFYRAGEHCGFANFPLLGLQAYKNSFYFDFDAYFVGTGMICPHLVNVSGLLGGIISWGIMLPLIQKKKGDWYPANVGDMSLRGIRGYRVFILMGMILGEGMYNFLKVLYRAVTTALVKRRVAEQEAHTDVHLRAVRGRRVSDAATAAAARKRVQDNRRRTEVFLEDQIPLRVAYGGYVAVAGVCVVTLSRIFPGFKWYYVVVVCTCAPVLAFCNAYGCGLTDWNLAYSHGGLAIFVVGWWAGAAHGGILAGLAACGMVVSVVFIASELIRDFKTGYLTLASRRAMFVSQAIGTAMGCVISPCVFWLFYQAFDVGTPGTDYPAHSAPIYRNMAILAAEGLGSSLPKHCLTLCYASFSAAFLISFVRDVTGKSRVARFVPIPTAVGIPLFFGSYIAIDMCLGSFIIYVWERVDRANAEAFGPAVASGLICGARIWRLPESVLSLAKVKSPICMLFLSRKTYEILLKTSSTMGESESGSP